MSDAARRLLDNLVKDLKTKLFAKMHQDIVEEIEKRDRVLQDKLDEVQSARNRCCSW